MMKFWEDWKEKLKKFWVNHFFRGIDVTTL